MNYECYAVRWLSDYRISLFLKGERLFYTKNTRLFGDDSQENATTITLRLLATTIPAEALRLLLTSISYRAKARKEMRRKPSMVPRRPPRSCCWIAPPGGVCQPVRHDL